VEEITEESLSLHNGYYLNHEFLDKWGVSLQVDKRHVALVVRPGVEHSQGAAPGHFIAWRHDDDQ